MPTISAIARYNLKMKYIFQNNIFNMEGYYEIMCKINGVMRNVVIDDYVPVYKTTNRPVFSKANQKCIWIMLI